MHKMSVSNLLKCMFFLLKSQRKVRKNVSFSLTYREFFRGDVISFFYQGSAIKISFLLIYIEDVVVWIASLLVTNGFHHVAFTNTMLSHQHDNGFLTQVFLNLINVCLANNCSHNLIFYNGYFWQSY